MNEDLVASLLNLVESTTLSFLLASLRPSFKDMFLKGIPTRISLAQFPHVKIMNEAPTSSILMINMKWINKSTSREMHSFAY
jgi:hypothetical protein